MFKSIYTLTFNTNNMIKLIIMPFILWYILKRTVNNYSTFYNKIPKLTYLKALCASFLSYLIPIIILALFNYGPFKELDNSIKSLLNILVPLLLFSWIYIVYVKNLKNKEIALNETVLTFCINFLIEVIISFLLALVISTISVLA